MVEARRTLIFAGGKIGDWALEELSESDFIIGVDSGAFFLVDNGITPDLAIGDFDSVTAGQFWDIKQTCEQVVSCDPIKKDYTDTEMAFDLAVSSKPSEIIMLGVTGTRFDHTLANVHLLLKGLKAGIPCRIKDEYNDITVIDKFAHITKGDYQNISLLPLSKQVTGITLEGFVYPLKNATLTMGESLAVSNVILPERDTGFICIESGELLVIKSKD